MSGARPQKVWHGPAADAGPERLTWIRLADGTVRVEARLYDATVHGVYEVRASWTLEPFEGPHAFCRGVAGVAGDFGGTVGEDVVLTQVRRTHRGVE